MRLIQSITGASVGSCKFGNIIETTEGREEERAKSGEGRGARLAGLLRKYVRVPTNMPMYLNVKVQKYIKVCKSTRALL
jgi:hypothetical protein